MSPPLVSFNFSRSAVLESFVPKPAHEDGRFSLFPGGPVEGLRISDAEGRIPRLPFLLISQNPMLSRRDDRSFSAA